MAEYNGVLLSDSMVLYDGDVAESTTILIGGSQYVSAGGSAISTTISNGGVQTVGGSVVNTTVSRGGRQDVVGGGSAITTKISYGEQVIYEGGIAVNTTISDGVQTIKHGSAVSTTLYLEGSQFVSEGGSAIGTVIGYDCIQYVSKGGRAVSTTISHAGVQYVVEGGIAVDTAISYGVQTIKHGSAISTTILEDSKQFVSEGGVAISTVILTDDNDSWCGQVIYNGGSALNTVVSSSYQYISSGGQAINTEIAGGRQEVLPGGSALDTVISAGEQGVVSGGYVSGTVLYGGVQKVRGAGVTGTVLQGGSQIVYSGGYAENTTILNDGHMTVTGKTNNTKSKAAGTTVCSGGVMDVLKGSAVQTKVSRGGWLRLSGGAAISSYIAAGGSATVYSEAKDKNARIAGTTVAAGTLTSAQVLSGGSLTLKKGGTATGVTVLYGGTVTVRSGATLNKLTVSSGGKAELAGGSLTGTAIIKGNGLSIAAKGSKSNKIKAGSRATISFDLRKVKAGKGTMLTLGNTWTAGNRLSVVVGKPQGMGTYRLAGGITAGAANSVTIKLGGSLLGYAAVNGDPLKKYGVSYAVSTGKNNSLSLTLSVAGGKMKIGNAHANTLTGTNASDIFYGGAGNDNITLRNGRDVAVYDAKAWGADVIGKANGTLTIVLAGLDKSKVKETLKGTTMTIAKKSASGQKITVQGWSAETHNIVYNVAAADLKAFTEYRNAASPTEAQAKAAQNSVFKAAKLA